LISIDQSGGIVKQSKDHKPVDQPGGSGMTVYYLVEDLEEVSCGMSTIEQSVDSQAQTQKRVEKSSGIVISGTENDSNSGMHMIFRDPQGNRFGAYALKTK
jgi:predicted enzyme related to lactoylglutathione lyase